MVPANLFDDQCDVISQLDSFTNLPGQRQHATTLLVLLLAQAIALTWDGTIPAIIANHQSVFDMEEVTALDLLVCVQAVLGYD